MRPLSDRRFSRSIVIRVVAGIILLLIGSLYVFSRTPAVTGISLLMENGPMTDSYYAVQLRAQDYYNPRDFAYTESAKSLQPTLLNLRLPHRIRNAHDAIRIRFGTRPGTHRLKRLTFDNALLLWHTPLVEWPLSELSKTAKPVQDIGEVKLVDEALSVITTGTDPQVEFEVNLKKIEAAFNERSVMIGRLAWILSFGVVIAVLVFADKLVRPFLSLITTRKQHARPHVAGFSGSKYWILAGIVLLLLAKFVLSWDNFTHPGLYVEDASHYFNIYYGDSAEFKTVFRKPHRYINVSNNFFAWAAAKADVRVQPTLYLLFALTIGTITAVILAFSGLFQNKWILLAAPLTLGLSGMNHIFYYNTLTFQMYNLIVLLLCLLLFPTPRNNYAWLVFAALLMTLIWSGPYSVLVIPVALLLALLFGDKRKTLLLVLLAVCTLLYYLTVDKGTTDVMALFTPQRFHYFLSVLFGDVLLLGLFGEATLTKGLLLIAVLTTSLYVLRKDQIYIKVSLVLWTITLASLAPYFMSIKYQISSHAPAHIYIGYFFWLVFLLFTADRHLQRSGSRAALAPAVFVAFCTFIVVDNVSNPYKRHVELMSDVPDFLQTVHHYEQLNLAAKNQYVIVAMDGIASWLGGSPAAIVGSRHPSARQLGPDDFPQPYGRVFVEKPRT